MISTFPKLDDQRGSVFLLLGVMLIALLIVIGLALDAGNLYRAQIAAQNSADSAALAGVGYAVRKGKIQLDTEVETAQGSWTTAAQRDTRIAAFLQPKTQEIARSVLGKSGYPHIPGSDYEASLTGTITTPAPNDASDVAFSYQVTVNRNVQLMLMHLIPGTGQASNQALTATATAIRRVANIVLFIDVSDSMNCPPTGNCDCLYVEGTADCPANNKMGELIDAVKAFIKMFDLARDNFYIVPFNTRGRAFSLDEYKTQLGVLGGTLLANLSETQIDQLFNAIGALNPAEGGTNMCDALMRGQKKLIDDGIFGSEDISYVLFTDGAPTAGRFLFANPKAALPAWDQVGAGAVYDYTHYSLEWGDMNDLSTTRYGPSILVQTDLLPVGYNKGKPPAEGTGTNDAGSDSNAGYAACSVSTDADNDNAPLRPVGPGDDLATIASDTFSPCLNDMSAHLPNETSRVYGAEYDDTSAGKSFVDWREQYFNCAVELTDQFRRNNGVVYVVGVGDPAAFGSDPYQGANDVFFRHDVFNARLANDNLRAVEAPQVPSGVTAAPYPEFTYAGYQGYSAISADGQQGVYLATPNAEELELLFEEIAKRILLRLTQ